MDEVEGNLGDTITLRAFVTDENGTDVNEGSVDFELETEDENEDIGGMEPETEGDGEDAGED